MPKGILPSEHRFNVVIHGVQESQGDVPRYQRDKSDLDKSLDILTTMKADINSFSIRDCFRLGKFKKERTHPRPHMVKLNRAVDVTSILSNRSRSPTGVSIKVDLTQEERRRDALLLAERWRLLQSGVDKKLTRIRFSDSYVRGKKYGEVVDGCFKLCGSQTPGNSFSDPGVEPSSDAAPHDEPSN